MDKALEEVKAFAAAAHRGQQRKYTPEPYIVHPVRVMEICAEYTGSLAVLSAALLHDVLEDTEITSIALMNFLRCIMAEDEASHTVQLVQELTDVYTKENCPQWNRRKRKAMEAHRIDQSSPDAQTIKYADIIDNCREIVKYDRQFGAVFLRECSALLRGIDKGNPRLYQKAKEMVTREMSRLRTPAPQR